MVASRTWIHAKIFILLGMFLAGSLVSAAGYEKSIMWGGRSAGLVGIGTPYAEGGEALYFNPAGLQKDKVGSDVSFFISPSWNSSKGPFNNSNAEISSETKMITPLALLYGYTPNSTWGFGAGFYVAGGSSISFKDVAYSTPTNVALSPSHINSDLQLYEFSLGAGYKVNDKLKLGVAWRADIAKASFAFAQRAGSGMILMNAEVNDVKANSYQGFRLGAQYKLDETTNLSFAYRSPVFLRGKGKFGGTARKTILGGDTPITENDVTAGTIFPQQGTLGAMHKLSDRWTLFEEYTITDYSIVDHVTLEGTLAFSGGGPGSDAPDLKQQWHDQHNIKLAAAYTGFAMPIYFGVHWISQVTATDYGRVSDVAPGPGYGATMGTEYQASGDLKLTGAAEYGLVKGDATGAAAGSAASDFRAGTFTSTSYALHLGAQYAF